MKQKTLKKLFVLFILGAVSIWGQIKPNIVYIMADDLGIGEIGAFGQTDIKTPNLDKMAEEGMKFNDFHAGSPVCGPSRCNLMTGLHGGHCRLRENDQDYLRPEDITMAEVLKAAGYVNGIFGKWGLSFNHQKDAWPTRQGFDKMVGYVDQRHAHNFWPTFLINNEDTIPLRNVVPNANQYGAGNATVEVDYAPQVMLDSALAFIRRNKDTTFFLYFASNMPHINNEASGQPDDGFEVPNGDVSMYANTNWPLGKKSYATMVSILDDHVGQLFKEFKDQGIDEKTFVFFTSDNGPTWLRGDNDGNTNVIGDWFNGRLNFRAYKGDIYEGGMRVPTLARWPSVIKPNSENDWVGSFVDILPTAAAMAGISAPTNLDGENFIDVLLSSGRTQRDPVTWYFPRSPNPNRSGAGWQYAVRQGKWKAVWYKNSNGNEVAALYDLETDPSESIDVKGSNSSIYNRFDSIRKAQVPNPARVNNNPVIANWTPAAVPPAVIKGCMDSSYQEYDPAANVSDPSLCQTLGISLTHKNKFGINWNGRILEVMGVKNYSLSIFDVSGNKLFSKSVSAPGAVNFSQFNLKGVFYLKINVLGNEFENVKKASTIIRKVLI